MRAVTKAALVEAVQIFMTSWDDTGNVAPDWNAVADLMRAAHALHMEDVENAAGGRFAGAYYNPARDDRRLTRQCGRVFDVMADGEWHTLADIQGVTGDPTPSISAQLRHLRKQQHGSWIIDDDHIGGRLFSYRMRNPDGTSLPPIMPLAYQPPASTIEDIVDG